MIGPLRRKSLDRDVEGSLFPSRLFLSSSIGNLASVGRRVEGDSSQMRISDRPEALTSPGRVSLILPLIRGRTLSGQAIAEYRRILEEGKAFGSIEVVTVGVSDVGFEGSRSDGQGSDVSTHVETDGSDWSASARAGLAAATGDHLVVLDVDRHYPPESLHRVVGPVWAGGSELAVAVPTHGHWRVGRWWEPRSGLGLVSRVFLGSSDVFSGLFAIRRSLWEQGGRTISASGSSLVLELLLRRPARAVDVPVPVDPQFRSPRLGVKHLRPLKHVLDGRYGNLSRLIQFCAVGASGMLVDLTFYAMFQWLLSFTWLVSRKSDLGFSWHLAIAAAFSITIALLWNFTLNRHLTFNDAMKGSWLRQFLTYVLSNALAIALSFSVRLYLPTRVAFFGRHRLAAAVVGIVAATGISFSMSRWIVFSRRADPNRSGPSDPRRNQGDRRHDGSTHAQVGPEDGVDERQADHNHRRRDLRPLPERSLRQT
jgi:dolichol-phosphate mannosyltransferase